MNELPDQLTDDDLEHAEFMGNYYLESSEWGATWDPIDGRKYFNSPSPSAL